MIKKTAKSVSDIVKTTVGVGRLEERYVKERISVCSQCPGNYALWKTVRGSKVIPKTQEHRQGLLNAGAEVYSCGYIGDKNPRTCGCYIKHKAKSSVNHCPNGWWPGDTKQLEEETYER